MKDGLFLILLFIIAMTWWFVIPPKLTCLDDFVPMFGLVEGSCPVVECGTPAN
jgi:hypothetical protein